MGFFAKLPPMTIQALTPRLTRDPAIRLPFALDPPVFHQNARFGLDLSGWAICPLFRVQEVILRRDGKIVASARPDQHRPGASRTFSELPGAETPGFRLTLAAAQAGVFELAVSGPDGQLITFAELELLEESRPQLFYMHIAKAGGSTVNRHLLQYFDPRAARDHIESAPEWAKNPAALQEYEFLSGHISLQAFDDALDASDFHLVTVMREPWSHLRSHLAWIRHLTDPGEERRYAVHPEPVQQFARRLADCDFTSPDALAKLVSTLEPHDRILVDNCQVRYFAPVTGEWTTAQDLEAAIAAQKRFDLIGTTDRLDEFFTALAERMAWPLDLPEKRENVTQSFYGLERPADDVRAALGPLITFDERLYRAVQQESR